MEGVARQGFGFWTWRGRPGARDFLITFLSGKNKKLALVGTEGGYFGEDLFLLRISGLSLVVCIMRVGTLLGGWYLRVVGWSMEEMDWRGKCFGGGGVGIFI